MKRIRTCFGCTLVSIFLYSVCVYAQVGDRLVVNNVGYYEEDGGCYSAYSALGEKEAEKLVIQSQIHGIPVTKICKFGFEEDKIGEISIPASIKVIEMGAFEGAHMNTLTIPKNVSSIYGSLAIGCMNLKEVYWETSRVKAIPQSSFNGCKNLKKISLSSGPEIIESYAFSSCISLESMKLPETVKSIRNFAFGNCTSLKKINIPSGVTEISGNAFAGADNLTIFGEKNSYAYYYAKANGIPFKSVGTEQKPITARPLIKTAKLSGNTLKTSLVSKMPGTDYTYYVVDDHYDLNDKNKFDTQYVRKVTTTKTSVVMYNLPKGNFKIYCKANKNGKFTWSNDVCFSVKKAPVSTPEITKATVKRNNVSVTLSKLKGSKGYDCVLAKEWGDKPYQVQYTIKNQTGENIVFKNVKPGIYYVSAHSFVKENISKGKKVFSLWSNYRKIIVK